MKKLLLIALLASVVSVTYMPMLGKVLGPTTAYAQNDDPGDDNQGDDDNQGNQQ